MQASSVPTSSALNVNSSAPSLMAASGVISTGFWTKNGLMPPAQVTYDHCTQERGYRRCARNPQTKTCPHFLPIQRRCCPTQGLFGQRYLHVSPKSGESLSNRRAFSTSIMCTPIRGHAFTVSAEMQGSNSINSLRTIGSFFRRKKKSPPCGPYFPGTFQCVETVRTRTLSHGSK